MKSITLSVCAIIAVIVSGCASKNEEPQSNPADIYKSLPDILADNGLTIADLSYLPNNDRPDLTFVDIIPQKTDIISDGPRFFLYINADQTEYWIEARGTINGKRLGRFGPLSESYAKGILKAIKDIQSEK